LFLFRFALHLSYLPEDSSMNLKLMTLMVSSLGLVLSSCGRVKTPVILYADTANALVSIEEGVDQETEFVSMVEGGQLRLQQPYFMDLQASSAFQNDWIEIREILETLRETQRLQNQVRIFIKMEASILKALATIIEENAITLSEGDALALTEAQTYLETTKATMQAIRNEIKSFMRELRTLMRSVNRPMMWDEDLILDVKAVLLAILPLTEDLTTNLNTVLPSLQAIRDLFIANLPSELSPITPEVLLQLDAFETAMRVLNTLQHEMKTVRKETRLIIKNIREIVTEMKANNITLSVASKAALALKRLAIQDAVASLKTIGEESKSLLGSLKNIITFANLALVNETLASLILQGEERLTILLSVQTLFLETIAILEA
jgi:hypothetical protein